MMTPRGIVTVLWSTLVWIALWGEATPANLLGGLAIGVATAWFVPLGRPDGRSTAVDVRPLHVLRFVGFFLWALVKSSAVVAWEIVTPGSRIHQGIIELRLATPSLGVATVIANAISLTPGTLTIDVAEDPLRLYVHVLHLQDMDAVRRDLNRLETLAIAAFPARVPDPEVNR